MAQIDIIYPTFNRLEFTRESLRALFANTAWEHVRRLYLYDDGSEDGTREYLASLKYPVEHSTIFRHFGGPVAAMNHYLLGHSDGIFAKIDNDAMVPPRWLEDSLTVMDACPELDLLGIDAFNRVDAAPVARSYREAKFIGGIGLMRCSAFNELPTADGRWGFTSWQEQHPDAKKGWIDPSIPFFLLDKIPFDPWRALSIEYIKRGWQRRWDAYEDNQSELWGWWKQ